MVSKGLRTSIVPPNVILFAQTNSVPDNFTHATSIHNKLLKQVPNSCTNPGSTGGSATHTHSGTAIHTHSVPSADHKHFVYFTIGSCPYAIAGNPGPGVPHTHFCHYFQGNAHKRYTNPANAPETVSPNAPTCGHSHSAQSNAPQTITYSVFKKDTVVNLRKKSIPPNTMLLWSCSLSSIPSRYSKDTTSYNRYFKTIPNSCTCPGVTGGNTCHTHGSSGTHTHAYTGTAHTHSTPPGTGIDDALLSRTGSSGSTDYHTHPMTYPTTGSTTKSGTHCAADCHTHDTLSLDIPHHQMVTVKKTNIGLRDLGIPSKAIVVWTCTLSTIPVGFALANGSNCTPNLLDRFPKQIATACTCPGTQAGSATHTHAAADHSHSRSTSQHSHSFPPGVYTGAAPTAPPAGGAGGPPGGSTAQPTHNHQLQTQTTGTYCYVTNTCPSPHQHGSSDHRPEYVEVAFIQRL